MIEDRAWWYKLKPNASQALALVSWLVLGISANLYMRINQITLAEFAYELSHLLSDNWYGPVLYILAYFLRPLTFFPGTPLTMLAGYVYGVGWGTLYAMIAGLISTAIPYGMGRWFADESWVKRRFAEDDSRVSALIRMMRAHPFQTILTTRFLYLPYDLVNFVAGSLHLVFVSFIGATALGNLMNVFIMVSLGASLEASLSEQTFRINPQLIMLSVAVWLVSFAITRYLKRHNKEIDDNE
ncbi:MAG: TVP38/TMEM64 family protein [Anaerolineae bacterium]